MPIKKTSTKMKILSNAIAEAILRGPSKGWNYYWRVAFGGEKKDFLNYTFLKSK